MRIDSPLMTNAVITGSFSGSFTGTGNFVGLEADSVEFANVLNKPTLVSGSAQIDITATTGYTAFSSSIASDIAGLDGEYATDAELNASSSALTTAYRSELNASSSAISSAYQSADSSLSSSLAVDIASNLSAISTLQSDSATKVELNASSSALISGYQSADTALSSSLAADIASNDGRLDTLEGKTLHSSSAQVDHDSTSNFVVNEHIDHSSVIITAGDGLSGGGDITTSRTIDVDNTVARTNANNTFSGIQTFNDITVNGTGSFAYIQSVTGSAKLIGDAYVVVNNQTPAERYAGLKVLDSGSTSNTASLEFDGQTNDWFYEYTDDGGVTTDHGVVLFGPEYATKGAPTYLTSNTILKGTGTHHVADSNITDNGTTIGLGSNVSVTGNISVTGTVDGRDVAADGSKLDGIESSAKDDQTITAGTGLTGGGTGDVTISHADTSTQASVNNSGRTFIQDITLDGFGHVTGITSATDSDTFVGTVTSVATGTGLTGGTITSTGTISLSHLGFQTLTDPNADRIAFWDDSAGSFAWLSAGSNITISGTTISATDTNTTYSAGTGVTLSGTTFSIGQAVATTSNVHFEGLMVGQTTGATANTIRCVGDVVAYYSSDAQFKDNVETLEGSLDKIKAIRGVRFDWNDKQDVHTGHDIGVIAQEVETVLPELVHYREHNDSKAVDYVKLTAVLIEAVKELAAKVEELEKK